MGKNTKKAGTGKARKGQAVAKAATSGTKKTTKGVKASKPNTSYGMLLRSNGARQEQFGSLSQISKDLKRSGLGSFFTKELKKEFPEHYKSSMLDVPHLMGVIAALYPPEMEEAAIKVDVSGNKTGTPGKEYSRHSFFFVGKAIRKHLINKAAGKPDIKPKRKPVPSKLELAQSKLDAANTALAKAEAEFLEVSPLKKVARTAA